MGVLRVRCLASYPAVTHSQRWWPAFSLPRAQHAYTAGILAAVQFRELEDLQTEHSTFIEEGAWARCCSLAFARIQGPASAQRACLCAGVTHVWTFLVSALTRLPNATQLCPRSRTRRG